MLITKRRAIAGMKRGHMVVRRFGEQGKQLADATTWVPDVTWASIKDNERRYYVVQDLYNQKTHHVRA